MAPRLLPTLAGLALLAGCAVPDRFADRAVDYNRSLEEAENRALLLNVLRAAADRPLYFTGFSALRGSMSVAVGTSAAATLGIDGGNSTALGALLAPSASLVNSPSFDLSVLDGQAFARGLLTPIDNNVLDVFYQQDRDMRRLLDLAVNRIDAAAGARRARFWNDPFFVAAEEADPAARDFGRAGFRCVRDLLAGAGLELRQGPALKPVHLTVPAAQLGDAEAIANALKAGLRFRPAGAGPDPRVELLRLGGDAAFVFPEDVPAEAAAVPSQRDMAERDAGGAGLSRYQANTLRLKLRLRAGGRGMSAVAGGREVPATAGPGCAALAERAFGDPRDGGAVEAEFVLFVRSTEAVVRYVGRRLCARYGPPVCGKSAADAAAGAERPEDEFLRLAPDSGGPALARVELDGRRFAVAVGDRASARTLAQLKQLIALHNRADDAPTTSAVTVVGAAAAAAR